MNYYFPTFKGFWIAGSFASWTYDWLLKEKTSPNDTPTIRLRKGSTFNEKRFSNYPPAQFVQPLWHTLRVWVAANYQKLIILYFLRVWYIMPCLSDWRHESYKPTTPLLSSVQFNAPWRILPAHSPSPPWAPWLDSRKCQRRKKMELVVRPDIYILLRFPWTCSTRASCLPFDLVIPIVIAQMMLVSEVLLRQCLSTHVETMYVNTKTAMVETSKWYMLNKPSMFVKRWPSCDTDVNTDTYLRWFIGRAEAWCDKIPSDVPAATSARWVP